MEWLLSKLSATTVTELEAAFQSWGALAFLGLFALELLRLALRKRLSWRILGDSLASFLTFGAFALITYGLLATAYVSVFFWVQLNFAVAEIPVTPLTVLALLLLCDLAYYWEHRFSHRVGLAWATHTVHHSSPHFNLSVAYRFGPMDGIWPLLFHLPLALVGFDPLLILACEGLVQLYQTALHTEVIGRLPRPVEAVFNTPSHHRVHHGSNPAYIDRNYGGILILWDRLFGSFAAEREPVRYGLTQQIDSNNPVTVFLHGFARLLRRSLAANTVRDAIYAWIAPPEWQPGEPRSAHRGWLVPLSTLAIVLLWTGSTAGMAQSGGGARPAGQSASGAAEIAPGELLRERASFYYEHAVRKQFDQAYTIFAEDALFHYRMDFGSYYGSSEVSFRANDPNAFEIGPFDIGPFDDYRARDTRFTITGVRLAAGGGTVEALLTESYTWDGYEGHMEARETLHFEVVDGTAIVSRFDSVQVYH